MAKKNLELQDEICKVPSINEIFNWNFNIPDAIMDAYYGIVRQPKSRDDVPDYYVGKLEHYNMPYYASVYGAFILSSEREIIYMRARKGEEGDKDYEHFKYIYLWPALKKYAAGFQHGFDNFLNDKINTKSSLSQNEDYKAQKIMDFLSNPFYRPGFSESYREPGVHVLGDWEEDGIDAGYFYCAWYLILDNYKLFEPYFKDHENKFKDADTFKDPIKNKNLIDFFTDGAYLECMEALRIVKDPIISDDNRYLLGPRQKGAFTAWFAVIKFRQKFKEIPTSSEFAKMVNKEISSLNLHEDGSTLNRNSTTSYNKYYSPLSKLIV